MERGALGIKDPTPPSTLPSCFRFECLMNSYLNKHQDHVSQFAINRVVLSTGDFIKLWLQDCLERSSPIPMSSTLRDPSRQTFIQHPYLTKGPTCKISTIPYPTHHHANNPAIATLPATTPLPLLSSSIDLPLRLNHNEIHRQPHNPQHRTHTRRNNTSPRIPPSPVLLPIYTQYIPRCRLMLEILTWAFTCVRSPSVWMTAVYLLGAVGVGDGVSGKRGEGYGIDYLGRSGDFVLV